MSDTKNRKVVSIAPKLWERGVKLQMLSREGDCQDDNIRQLADAQRLKARAILIGDIPPIPDDDDPPAA